MSFYSASTISGATQTTLTNHIEERNRNTNQRTAPPIKTKHAFVSERYSYCRKCRNTDKFCPPLLLKARFRRGISGSMMQRLFISVRVLQFTIIVR